MVLVAYAASGLVGTAAALRDSALCIPTDSHSLLVNKLSFPLKPNNCVEFSSSQHSINQKNAFFPPRLR